MSWLEEQRDRLANSCTSFKMLLPPGSLPCLARPTPGVLDSPLLMLPQFFLHPSFYPTD